MEDAFHKNDTPEQRRQIKELIKLGYPVERKTHAHVKILTVNYFITTGTITIDPCIRHKQKGYDALLKLLREMYGSTFEWPEED